MNMGWTLNAVYVRASWMCWGLLAGCCLTAGAVHGQPFPNRPVTIIVPYGVGTGNDVIARAIAEKITAPLGKPVVIENADALRELASLYLAQAAARQREAQRLQARLAFGPAAGAGSTPGRRQVDEFG